MSIDDCSVMHTCSGWIAHIPFHCQNHFMAFAYYRCDWAHAITDDPIVILYEVDDEGRVPRMIEIFEGGRRACISTDDFVGRENEMPGINSLVEGDFRDSVKEMLEGPGIDTDGDRITLAQCDHLAFETEWFEYR